MASWDSCKVFISARMSSSRSPSWAHKFVVAPAYRTPGAPSFTTFGILFAMVATNLCMYLEFKGVTFNQVLTMEPSHFLMAKDNHSTASSFISGQIDMQVS